MSGLSNVLRRLKALRNQRALSQYDLAAALGVNRSTYVRKEQGHIPITTEEWIKLAAFMGVEASYFFADEGADTQVLEDGKAETLASFYSSLDVMEQEDLLTLIIIAFKGIKRKKVRETLARLKKGR